MNCEVSSMLKLSFKIIIIIITHTHAITIFSLTVQIYFPSILRVVFKYASGRIIKVYNFFLFVSPFTKYIIKMSIFNFKINDVTLALNKVTIGK